MLILTRHKEESVIINGNIKIKVLRIDKRGTVRLGFEAPEEVVEVLKEATGEITDPDRQLFNVY